MRKKNFSITKELEYLEKVQSRCVDFSNYLESHHDGRYDDLYLKVASVVGSIEDLLSFDEER